MRSLRPSSVLAVIGLCLGAACVAPRRQPAARELTTSRPAECLAGPVMQALGKDRLLLGAMMEDEVAAQLPFDLRYVYIAGGLFDGAAPPDRCAPGDEARWWGCWQSPKDPPGEYLRRFIARAGSRGQVPMVTYYQLLHATGVADGVEEVAALNDAAVMARYFEDWRFLLRQVGDHRVLLHLEPDLWGYAQHAGTDPRRLPAAVARANPTDCADLPDTVAGFSRCLLRMARRHAPNALVGLHASFWATKIDVSLNRRRSLDVAAEARKTGAYLRALGAQEGDFLVIGASDRDAAWYRAVRQQDRWWDPSNTRLPNFEQAFSWARTVSEAVGRPHLWWQLPLGNASLPDRELGWRDNRVDYFLDHPDRVVAAHGFGMAFGAGMKGQTTPSTDGGHFVRRARRYFDGGPPAVCAVNVAASKRGAGDENGRRGR